MRWFSRRSSRRARYSGLDFDRVGDPETSRRWSAAGASGPLTWTAWLARLPEGVRWSLTVEGTLTGEHAFEGRAANPYAAATECRSALRGVIDDHNEFVDVAG